jgi:ABC-2 type transport system permease protein
MSGAFVYLAVCSMRNRLHVRLRRLREPRYFLGLVIGMAYVGFVLTRPTPAAFQSGPLPRLDDGGLAVGLVGAVGLLFATAVAWILPGSGRPALTFSRADVQFLFTAPLSRRQLLHYKLLRSQAGAILGSALVTLVFRPRTLSQGWTFFLGTMLVMATVNLHLTGVSLRRESLRVHGTAAVARQWLPLALVIAAVSIVGVAIAFHWAALSSVSTPRELFGSIRDIGELWPVRIVLWPFLALMRLPLSNGAAQFFAALPLAFAALLANYLWVIRSDVAFEEAAARDAEQHTRYRRAGARAPSLPKRRPEPFLLRPTGRPEIALLWKNLILSTRAARLATLWRVMPVLVLVAFVVSQAARTAADALATIAALAAAGVTLIGPQVLRNDLRQDLAQIATLKQWPLSGATIVRGEVLAPTLMLSAIVATLVTVALLLSTRVTFDMHLDWPGRISLAVATMLVAPGIILVQVVVQNALAILFPAWMDLGATSARGMEVMGQRVLAAGGIIVAVGLALLPALVVSALASVAVRTVFHVNSALVPAGAASVTLLAESLLAIAALGRVVDRTDASAIPPVE